MNEKTANYLVHLFGRGETRTETATVRARRTIGFVSDTRNLGPEAYVAEAVDAQHLYHGLQLLRERQLVFAWLGGASDPVLCQNSALLK